MNQINLQWGTSQNLFEANFNSIILDIPVLKFNICLTLFLHYHISMLWSWQQGTLLDKDLKEPAFSRAW